MARLLGMRRTILLVLISALVLIAVYTTVNRFRVDAWFNCTMPQWNESPSKVSIGDPFDSIAIEEVISLDGALAVDFHPGSNEMYVATKGGTVEFVSGGTAEAVLDFSDEVSTTLEQGLLGLVFHPDGTHLYLNYTDTAGDTNVVEYEVDEMGMPAETSKRQVLLVEQPSGTHNGGHIEFGPDGYLWIGLGDGGGSLGGPETGFGENSQDLGSLLGSILRIDPRPGDGSEYTIPADNPFVDVAGARGEIWTLGLRNPWRFSFDSATGDLWIGDVGEFCWEEINFLAARDGMGAAENLGWPIVEGPDKYRGGSIEDVTWAVYDLPHAEGNRSIVGGIVYRGSALPELEGWYVFSETYIGNMRALRINADGGIEVRSLSVDRTQTVSFAEGPAGELYVVSFGEGVSKLVLGSETD